LQILLNILEDSVIPELKRGESKHGFHLEFPG